MIRGKLAPLNTRTFQFEPHGRSMVCGCFLVCGQCFTCLQQLSGPHLLCTEMAGVNLEFYSQVEMPRPAPGTPSGLGLEHKLVITVGKTRVTRSRGTAKKILSQRFPFHSISSVFNRHVFLSVQYAEHWQGAGVEE